MRCLTGVTFSLRVRSRKRFSVAMKPRRNDQNKLLLYVVQETHDPVGEARNHIFQ